MADSPANDELLTKVCRYYEEWCDATRVGREESERDRDYYDGKQLTDTEIATLKKRGQPTIIINRTKPKIDFLLGMERQMRTDPKAAPRTPQDEGTANAATDSIRYVCDDQNFSQTRSFVFENEIIEGYGGCIVEIKPNLDVLVNRIPWDRIFSDAHSRERDFSDAKIKGIVVWMDMDDAMDLYKDKVAILEVYNSNPGFFDTYADKPKHLWYDSKRKRVRICEAYYRESGVWRHCVYTKAGFLVDPKDSQYVDEDEVPTCPIELVSANVDRENNRYGVVRQLIGPQDEINKRRSKALHLLTMRQTKGERGAVDDVAKMKREMAKPDGHVEVTPGMLFEVMNNNDQAQGQLELLQEAKNEIDAIGANAALAGKDTRDQSGRALQARQQGGLTELGPVFDALRMWQRAVYKQIWNRIKQYWTSEKWVRITDDEQNIKFVGLNQPVTMGEQLIEQAKAQGAPPDQLQMMVQQLSQDPQAQQPAGMKNDVRQMDVDIILEDVPDVVNLQSEQFELLSQMYQANPQVVPFKAVIQASSLRNKSAIIDELNKNAEQQAQMQQAQQQQGMAAAQANTQKTQSETQKNVADAANKEQETTLKRMEAVLMAMHAHMQINAPLGQPTPGPGEQNAAEYRAM